MTINSKRQETRMRFLNNPIQKVDPNRITVSTRRQKSEIASDIAEKVFQILNC